MNRGRVTLGAFVLVLGGSLTGCSSLSEPSPTAGVDTLVIPTPSPDPDDFVATIDNPWLPYQPGAAWVYDVAGVMSGEARVQVRDGTEPIAGVATTVVETLSTTQGGDLGVRSETTDYYAQDRDGNVWWFGREGEWEAGVDLAQAGLVMAATPRAGDGYWMALSVGDVEDRARVVSVADDLVVIEGTSELRPDVTTLQSYAPDVGLVRTQTSTSGVISSWELVSGP